MMAEHKRAAINTVITALVLAYIATEPQPSAAVVYVGVGFVVALTIWCCCVVSGRSGEGQ